MSRLLSVAGLQVEPVAWDVEATLAKLEDEARAVVRLAASATVLVWPEYYLTAGGSVLASAPAHHDPARLAEPLPGPLSERLGALAEELGTWLLPGTVYERDDDGSVYNTALVLSPAGELVATYRKAFPWRPMEPEGEIRAGRTLTTFDLPGCGRAGLMICWDGIFPEIPRNLAWLGAEVIFHVSATPTPEREQEVVLARANAIANQVYVVNVNTAGPTGMGRSVIVDPDGRILQEAPYGPAFLSETLDLERVSVVRERGLLAVQSRPLEQLEHEGPGLELPLYGGVRRRCLSPKTRPDLAPGAGRDHG
jgi:formamidase